MVATIKIELFSCWFCSLVLFPRVHHHQRPDYHPHCSPSPPPPRLPLPIPWSCYSLSPPTPHPSFPSPPPPSPDRLVGLVVRRPPRERKIPDSNTDCAGIFYGVDSYQYLKIGTPVATLPGAWRYRVSTGTGRPGVSIL